MTTTTTTDATIANEILAQLGGPQFIAMTGSTNFLTDGRSLTCKLGRGAKNPVGSPTHLRITLTDLDLYCVEAIRCTRKNIGAPLVLMVVYNDMLKATVERLTGFYLTFGPRTN